MYMNTMMMMIMSLELSQLFKILDIVNQVKPDERCVMAYVSSYYHAFSGAQQVNQYHKYNVDIVKKNCR